MDKLIKQYELLTEYNFTGTNIIDNDEYFWFINGNDDSDLVCYTIEELTLEVKILRRNSIIEELL